MVDVLARIFSGGGLAAAGTPGPGDNFWYRGLSAGGLSLAGEWVDPESAQKLSAWYRGRLLLATVLAMLPLPVYRRLPDDGGSEAATGHPLYEVLHNRPNSWQDSFQWRREMMFNIIDHGWGFNWIMAGSRGFVDELHPIDPTTVRPKQIRSGPMRGRYLFDVRDPESGRTTTHTQDEIFFLRGADGKGILEFARTSLGTAMANESYAANIFSRGTLSGGYIKVPGTLKDDAGRRMAESFLTKPGEHHLPKLLEQGAEYIETKMTPEQAQMLLSRRFSVDDIARWLGVPRQFLENSDPSFGNAEQFDEAFLTYSMGGWLSLFEFAINNQLILAPQTYYAEFTRDAIARGKLVDRWNVHIAAVNAGLKSVDEARRKEGLNARGGKAAELREPQNITGKPTAAVESSEPPTRQRPRQAPPAARATAIVVESASRLLLKEVAEVRKLAVRHAADADAFAAAVADFYAAHASRVAQWLQLSSEQAERYCAGQAAQLVAGSWVAALEQWTSPDYAAGLAALALEEAL